MKTISPKVLEFQSSTLFKKLLSIFDSSWKTSTTKAKLTISGTGTIEVNNLKFSHQQSFNLGGLNGLYPAFFIDSNLGKEDPYPLIYILRMESDKITIDEKDMIDIRNDYENYFDALWLSDNRFKYEKPKQQ